MKTVTDAVRELGGVWPKAGDPIPNPDGSFGCYCASGGDDLFNTGSLICTKPQFEAEAERLGYRRENYLCSESFDNAVWQDAEWDGDGFPPIGWHGECIWGRRVSWHECVMLPNHRLAMARHSTTDSDWLVADIECEALDRDKDD